MTCSNRVSFAFLLVLLCGVLVSAPAGSDGVATVIQPPVAEDLNPAADIVEVNLEAMEAAVDYGAGNQTMVWSYNGMIPGPTIEAEVGDVVVVNFKNSLPEETTIHWHGMELPANMDGSHISQLLIQPGETFRYEFQVRRASLFWYHPHVRTNAQVEKGLYGALIVRDPEADAALGLPETEHILVLDDVLLDDNGQVVDPFPSDPVENATMQVNGRHGNTLLVNGKPDQSFDITANVPHRLRLVNVSNSRFMRVCLSSHPMYRIGGDGGLLENPIELEPVELVHDHHTGMMISDPDPTKGIILTPGERADIVFTPISDEQTIYLEWHDIARGRHSAMRDSLGNVVFGHDHHDGKGPMQNMLALNLSGDPATEQYVPPADLRTLNKIDATGAAPIPLMFGHSNPDAEGNVTFFIQMKDGMPLPFDKVTADDAPKVVVGDTRIWEVNNLTAGEHNFHMHGFSFQHLETEWLDMDNPENNKVVPAAYLEDKDTIILPRRPGAKGRSRTVTRLAVKFDDTGREGLTEAYGREATATTSGGWLMHCHILEHSARGMMSFFQVFNTPSAIRGTSDATPATYALSQNYPNPFNPSTTIHYTLPQSHFVTLKVFDLLGKEVDVIFRGRVAAGNHTVKWTPGHEVSSGVYLYRLDAGDFQETRKLMLMK